MKPPPAFLFYASDWLSSPRILIMTPAERGGYINLLAYQWLSPDCSLPDDDKVLAEMSGLREGYFKGSSRVLRDCFPAHPTISGRIANEKLLGLYAERQEWREKCAKGGRTSRKTRGSGETDDAEGYLKGSSRVVEGYCNTSSSSSLESIKASMIFSKVYVLR